MRLCSSVVALALLHTIVGILSAADEAPPAHKWTTIAYPPLPSMPEGTITPSLSLNHPDEDGFQFVLNYYVARNSDEPRPEKPAADKITVRLHLPDGKVVEPKVDALRGGVGFGNSRGVTYHYPYKFPWSRNVLEEAWIELRLPERTFWVEVPYGFLRNPTAAQTPLEARSGPPKLAAKMKDMDKKDSIVPWHHARYDLGPIQNNWHLSVSLANPFDAQAEIVLYRDSSQVGKSMYLWDLHSPRTTIRIKQPGDAVLQSRCISLRLHDDGMRRSDSFKFNRNPGEDERCWGTAAIKVDDKSYEFLVPSSLFKYVHGVADPYHKALVPRGRD